MLNGNIQKLGTDGSISVINFEKTQLSVTGLATKSISEPKVQETSTFDTIKCMRSENVNLLNCKRHENEKTDTRIEINKRFGMPIFIPLISLISCFLLSSRKESKMSDYNKYVYFFVGFFILTLSEITVRYSGISLNNTIIYYLIPISLLPLIYLLLIRKFKYENLQF